MNTEHIFSQEVIFYETVRERGRCFRLKLLPDGLGVIKLQDKKG